MITSDVAKRLADSSFDDGDAALAASNIERAIRIHAAAGENEVTVRSSLFTTHEKFQAGHRPSPRLQTAVLDAFQKLGFHYEILDRDYTRIFW